MFVNTPSQAVKAVQEQFEKLEATLLSLKAQPPKKVEGRLPSFEKVSSNWSLFNRTFRVTPKHVAKCFLKDSGYYSANTLYSSDFKERVLSTYDKAVEEYKSLCAPYIEEVESAVKHNLEQIESVKTFMASIGIHANYSTYEVKPRRKSPVKVDHVAGFVEDLNRVFPTNNLRSEYDRAMDLLKVRRAEIEKAIDNEISEAAKIEAEKKAEKQKEENLKKLITLAIVYECETNIGDVLKAIISRCKYLELADAMYNTRNDWSTGFGLVESVLPCFKIENPEDRSIVEELSSILEGDETDGRIFRDCVYNYSVLYGMVDPQLLADYNEAKSLEV